MIWYVALGSAIGGVLRYLLGGLIQERSGTPFPIGTLFINVSGSVVPGFIQRRAPDPTAPSREVSTMPTTGAAVIGIAAAKQLAGLRRG